MKNRQRCFHRAIVRIKNHTAQCPAHSGRITDGRVVILKALIITRKRKAIQFKWKIECMQRNSEKVRLLVWTMAPFHRGQQVPSHEILQHLCKNPTHEVRCSFPGSQTWRASLCLENSAETGSVCVAQLHEDRCVSQSFLVPVPSTMPSTEQELRERLSE